MRVKAEGHRLLLITHHSSLVTNLMDLHFVNDLVGQFGLPAIFFLTMAEGDITLLLAGVLAHGQAFGEYSFLQVLLVGTLGGRGERQRGLRARARGRARASRSIASTARRARGSSG